MLFRSEGLIHITELGGEYFRFDEARQELRGERSGVRYGVGTRVRVQVSRVDLDSRKIDFRMVKEGGETQQRGSSGGGRRRGNKGDERASARPVAVDWEGDTSAQDELALVRDRDLARTIRTLFGVDRARRIQNSLEPQCLSGFRKDDSFRIVHSDVAIGAKYRAPATVSSRDEGRKARAS